MSLSVCNIFPLLAESEKPCSSPEVMDGRDGTSPAWMGNDSLTGQGVFNYGDGVYVNLQTPATISEFRDAARSGHFTYFHAL